MAGRTNRWTIIPISVEKLRANHQDTSACWNIDHFFQAICLQYQNPSSWTVGRMDERIKWQHPSALMPYGGKSSGYISMPKCRPFLPSDLSAIPKLNPMDGRTDGQMHEMTTIPIGINVAEVKSSGYINMPNLMPFIPSNLSVNAQKPENVVNGRADGRTIIPLSMNKLRVSRRDTSACQNIDFSSKRFVSNTKTQAHGQLDRRTNAWNDDKTHRHRCRIGVSYLDT